MSSKGLFKVSQQIVAHQGAFLVSWLVGVFLLLLLLGCLGFFYYYYLGLWDWWDFFVELFFLLFIVKEQS